MDEEASIGIAGLPNVPSIELERKISEVRIPSAMLKDGSLVVGSDDSVTE